MFQHIHQENQVGRGVDSFQVAGTGEKAAIFRSAACLQPFNHYGGVGGVQGGIFSCHLLFAKLAYDVGIAAPYISNMIKMLVP